MSRNATRACVSILIAWIGARVGEGLHHAHEVTDKDGKSIELVHRDVNASNIFVTYDGHVKLIDFGLVKATNRVTSTIEGIVKGKLAYLSPEQALGKPVDRRTDIFALGATLWELTTDRRLFKKEKDLGRHAEAHQRRDRSGSDRARRGLSAEAVGGDQTKSREGSERPLRDDERVRERSGRVRGR